MATRSRTTFKKRQKEMARVEKQREKAAKRVERREGEHAPEPEVTLEEATLLRLQGYNDDSASEPQAEPTTTED